MDKGWIRARRVTEEMNEQIDGLTDEPGYCWRQIVKQSQMQTLSITLRHTDQ